MHATSIKCGIRRRQCHAAKQSRDQMQTVVMLSDKQQHQIMAKLLNEHPPGQPGDLTIAGFASEPTWANRLTSGFASEPYWLGFLRCKTFPTSQQSHTILMWGRHDCPHTLHRLAICKTKSNGEQGIKCMKCGIRCRQPRAVVMQGIRGKMPRLNNGALNISTSLGTEKRLGTRSNNSFMWPPATTRNPEPPK